MTPSAGFSLPKFNIGAAATKAEAPKAEKKAEKKEEVVTSDGIDPRSIALPGELLLYGCASWCAGQAMTRMPALFCHGMQPPSLSLVAWHSLPQRLMRSLMTSSRVPSSRCGCKPGAPDASSIW